MDASVQCHFSLERVGKLGSRDQRRRQLINIAFLVNHRTRMNYCESGSSLLIRVASGKPAEHGSSR